MTRSEWVAEAERLRPYLIHWACQSGFPRDEAPDVVQSVLLYHWRRLLQGEEARNLAALLWRNIAWLGLNRKRDMGVWYRWQKHEELRVQQREVEHQRSWERLAQLRMAVRDAVLDLPTPRHREHAWRVWGMGEDPKVMAEETGLTREQTYTMLEECREALRVALAEYDPTRERRKPYVEREDYQRELANFRQHGGGPRRGRTLWRRRRA